MSGVRTVEDIRDRCYVDELTGCWLWRGATSARGYPSLWMPALRRVATLGHAIALLQTGRLPAKGVVWYCTCTTKNCGNPMHRAPGTRADQMRKAGIVRSPLVRARMAAGRRVDSKLTEDAVADIRGSTEILRVVAERHGISISHASHIRRGEQRKPLSGHGASVFNIGVRVRA
jgi:hypothetical protein